MSRLLRAPLVVFLVAACLAAPAAATPARVAGPGRVSGLPLLRILDQGVCSVTGRGLAEGAKALYRHSTDRGLVAADLFITFVASSVEKYCSDQIEPVTNLAQYALSHYLHAPTTSATVANYRSLFVSVRAEQTASELRRLAPKYGWQSFTGRQVRSLVGAVCVAVARNQDPIAQAIGPALPGADLDALGALNAIVGATLNCRFPPTARQVGYLNSSMLGYAIANTPDLPDLEPPVVLLLPATDVTLRYGGKQLTCRWLGLDRKSGVVSYSLWVSINDADWQQVDHGVTREWGYVDVNPGTIVTCAVQATDKAGNRSPWAYGPRYRA